MTKKNQQADLPLQEQPFVSHLLELRDRLLRAVVVVAVFFVILFPFANDIYIWVATPLMVHLPAGTSMIATEVASPFLTPFKLSLVAALFLAMPFILYQLWAFVAPGLYKHEKRLIAPLVASSTVLFYLGMVFAYYVVFPLVFAFLTSAAPEGVTVATDISKYLDFILTLFFAFGLAFEIPIATIILVWMGVTTPDKLAEKRPYIIVGVFLLGMLLTPPDVISQTLLALPMWILFEMGLLFSRGFVRRREQARAVKEEESEANSGTQDPSPGPVAPAPAAATGSDGWHPESEVIPGFDGDPSPAADQPIDPDRFVPLTEEELDAELDIIESEEADEEDEEDEGGEGVDPVEEKLRQVQVLREREDLARARDLLYEVLAQGNDDQIAVARNILQQLDEA